MIITAGWGKAAWVIFVVVIPWIGVLVYLIVNHDGMAERKMTEAQASQAQFDEYVRKTAGGTGGPAPRSRRLSSCSTVARSHRLSSTPSRPRRSRSACWI